MDHWKLLTDNEKLNFLNEFVESITIINRDTNRHNGKAEIVEVKFYDLENESLPQVGQYFVVLNSKDLPVAIIQLTEVSILPMNEVPVEFALAEGGGDYDFWWNAHKQFLTNELQVYGLDFSEDMPLVCERFKVIYTV